MYQEEKITLDKETFKSLASETRISILKALLVRRKTLSEISKQFKMSPSTIKEHMDNLVKAGLIEQKDEGHKWKYYELTKKGKGVLFPGERNIWVMLSIGVLGMLGVGYSLLSQGVSPLFQATMKASEMLEAPAAVGGAPAATAQIPYFHILGFVILSIIIGFSIGYLFFSRRRYAKSI
jgi:DNA-binding transcriptional ArsR family regulator